MFDADRPIQHSDQDKLNRSIFAKYLARCMLDHVEPESLVIGLYGGWGVGKTSIINLALEELNFAASNMLDNEKPIILNFSAWSYSGQHQLVYSFFRRLSSVLRDSDLKRREDIVHLLELYVSYFTRQSIPKALRRKRTILQKLHLQAADSDFAWETGRDLTDIKAALNMLLSAENRKLIIIIDNISRLYDDEIRQIFQIVKSMGDYSHTIYLLAFDKDQVINALDRTNSDGKAFIEKIVQLPFDVPTITVQDIETIFADRLQPLIAQAPQDSWDKTYWAEVYFSSLKYFFENCRDITRYINTLNFSFPRIDDLVNPVDFFALTAIEVFMPNVYAGIRDNKDLFTDLLDHVYELTPEEREKERKRCDEILARANGYSHDAVRTLCMQLFPRLRRIYQPNEPFHYSDAKAQQDKRIASPDFFDIYFRLSLQPGQLPKAEFEAILAEAVNPAEFDQGIMRLNQDSRILKFLNQLDDKVIAELPKENISAITDALIDNADLFPPGESNLLSLDTPMQVYFIIHRLLRRFKLTEERFDLLQHAIAKATKSLAIIIFILHEISRTHRKEEATYLPENLRDINATQLTSLQRLAISRIQFWARNNSLLEHPQLAVILSAWLEWGDPDEARAYVKQITTTDHGLLAFLTAELTVPIKEASSTYHKSRSWDNSLKMIQHFIPPKELEAHAKMLFEHNDFEKLRENEQLALMIFLDLLGTKTNKIVPKTTA